MAVNGGDVKFTLSGDSTKLNASLRDASANLGKMHRAGQGAANSLSKELKTAAKGAAIGLAAVGTAMAATAKAGFSLAAASSAYLDEMVHGAALAGLTTKEFTTMGFAIEAAGGKAHQLTPAMATLTDAMASAREGTAAYEDAFGALGVSVENSDGSLRDSSVVFGEVTSALTKLESQTEKSAAAQAIFGKRNASVALALGDSAEIVEEFGAVVDDMISPEALAASAEFDKSMARLKLSSQNATVQIGSALTPVITDLMDAATELTPVITNVFKNAVPFVENFVNGTRFAWAAIKDLGLMMLDAGKVIVAAFTAPLRAAIEAGNKLRELMGKDPLNLKYLEEFSMSNTLGNLTERFNGLGKAGSHSGDLLISGWFGAPKVLDDTADSAEGVAGALDKVTDAAKTGQTEFEKWLEDFEGFKDEFDPSEFTFKSPEEIAELEEKAYHERLGFMSDFVSASGDLAEGLSERLGASAEEQAMTSYIVGKASALADIGVNTIVAASKAAAQTGIGAAVAVPAIYALGATQAAAVLATPAPKFHSGGMIAPDEQLITAQTGEAVLSRSGVAAAGGASGVNELNRGGAAGGAIVVVNQYRHRVFDSFIIDNLRRTGSPLAAAIGATGSKAGIS